MHARTKWATWHSPVAYTYICLYNALLAGLAQRIEKGDGEQAGHIAKSLDPHIDGDVQRY